MDSAIIIRPVISEKSEQLSGKLGKYTFIVKKSANKIQIKDAVEKQYGVSVDSVKVTIGPSKTKVRNTKSGLQRGRVGGLKKAIITLASGEEIDFFGEA